MMLGDAPEVARALAARFLRDGRVPIMRALALALIIGGLAACASERGSGQRYDRITGYSDFRTEGPRGLETLDRSD